MPKGQSPKLKGVLCNVPIDVADICNILPRPADSKWHCYNKTQEEVIIQGSCLFKISKTRHYFQIIAVLNNY